MKEVYIFGTCRVCYLQHKNITFKQCLRDYYSRYYTITTNIDNIDIYTEPVNYTTKLVDILDSILYMKGKLYETLDPFSNKNLQSIFFRGHKEKHFIRPKTHPNTNLLNHDIHFDKIIIEISSIKQYIIQTKKYGEEFYLKNLPWKISVPPGYEHNNIFFDETDFLCKTMTKEECFEILDTIKQLVNCPILIIGPYISRKVPLNVNEERKQTQDILKEYSLLHSIDYFDLSDTIKFHNIETDEAHINAYGIKKLTRVMYNFMVK